MTKKKKVIKTNSKYNIGNSSNGIQSAKERKYIRENKIDSFIYNAF